ncbi:peptidoglycan/LPS O-acetylase OafA/YrhL [Bradyrhizobium sp. GM22.5]
MANGSLRIRSVDGLRAIATLAVLFFHVDRDLLPGGYLGVDLFFVISGFVVTKSIVESDFSYRSFLTNRFYRLYPAAATTILLTLLAFQSAGEGLLTDEVLHSAFASFTATSNFYFMRHSSYFDTALQGNPLLHFWSLSVEEQFYIAWPWLIVSVSRSRFASNILILTGLAILSAAISFWSPTDAFYLMPARAFQFGAGALVYFVLDRYRFSIPSITMSAMLASSLLLFFTLDGTQSWPLAVLLPTTLFAGMVFLAGAQPEQRFLLLGPVQFIGLASYSIYLVHWPIIVYSHIIYGVAVPIKAIAFVSSILGGVTLHYAIELPLNFRASRKSASERSRWAARLGGPSIALATAFVMAVISFQIHTSARPIISASSSHADGPDTAVTIYSQTQARRDEAITKTWACNTFEPGRMTGDRSFKLLADLDLAECLKGSDLLLADSTAEVAIDILATTGNAENLAQLNSAGCSFALSAMAPDCNRMNTLRASLLSGERCSYAKVYLGFKWAKYRPNDLHSLFELLAKSPCTFVVMSQLPAFAVLPEQVLRANNSRNADLLAKVSESVLKATNAVEGVSRNRPNIRMLYWSPLDKPNPTLPILTAEGDMIYRDDYHYTPAGKKWFVLQFLRSKFAASLN